MQIRYAFLGLCFTSATVASADPTLTATFSSKLQLGPSTAIASRATQMTWGPDGRLYVSSENNGVHSYAYSHATGVISDQKQVVSGINGLGIAFHGSDMYLSSFNGSIYRLRDNNGNGVYGESAETRVAIATGIPTGDHSIDNIQIKGNSLYVGIGTRTINGRKGEWTSGSQNDFGGSGFWSGGNGKTWGESAYGGTISWIKDLNQVADTTGSANAYANTTLNEALINNANPYSAGANKLAVHSAGTRNPYGLAFDRNGDLFFSNNFNRVDSNGDGTSGFGRLGDTPGGDLSREVHDQFFKAALGADYGYANDVWRGNTAILDPNDPNHNRVNSLTFDNSYNPGPYTLHDPANPDGLGPSSSATGLSFFYNDALGAYNGNAFLTRWNQSIGEDGSLGTNNVLNYADLVAIDPATGKVVRVASGFNNPIGALWDGQGRLLVADYQLSGSSNGGIYTFNAVPEPTTVVALGLGLIASLRRRKRNSKE